MGLGLWCCTDITVLGGISMFVRNNLAENRIQSNVKWIIIFQKPDFASTVVGSLSGQL